MSENYDSLADTVKHITLVRGELKKVTDNLTMRSHYHDASKTEWPEKPVFDEFTPKLAELEYGSDEYKAALAGMKPALDHHYAHNSHHPEHYENGISGMSLLDLIEMICDWRAAGERHPDGDIRKSLQVNIGRFGIEPQLASILQATIDELWPEG